MNEALSIWEEGLRIPPIKIFESGVLNEPHSAVILNNTRTPDMNRSDLMALIGGCRAAERARGEICERFGRDTFAAACDALLERTREAMAQLIRQYIPEEPVSFTDWVDDDGLGNGPFKMVLTIWREGDVCVFDWTGTDPQADRAINFHIHEGLCKLFFGIYMIMAFVDVEVDRPGRLVGGSRPVGVTHVSLAPQGERHLERPVAEPVVVHPVGEGDRLLRDVQANQLRHGFTGALEQGVAGRRERVASEPLADLDHPALGRAAASDQRHQVAAVGVRGAGVVEDHRQRGLVEHPALDDLDRRDPQPLLQIDRASFT